MNWTDKDVHELDRLFNEMVAIQSDTGTELERNMSKYIYNELKSWKYFKNHLDHVGAHKLPNDPYGRSVIWALIKQGPETVVLMNHHDAVDIEEYSDLKSYALHPKELKRKLMMKQLPEEVVNDFHDDEWIFGRGTADMKSGIALQMMMVKKVSNHLDQFEANEQIGGGRSLLFLSVCDEENLSAGMREAVNLMKSLEEKHDLKYVTAINSEPYMKDNESQPIFYEGSVGKTMAVILARGKKAHVGNVFEGLNPTFLLSQIQVHVELNPEFSDAVEGEVSPPPTFVYMRDQKKMYDASIPECASAYFSLLTLKQKPSEIIEKLTNVSKAAFEMCLKKHNDSHTVLTEKALGMVPRVDLKPRVMTYQTLMEYLIIERDIEFQKDYQSFLNQIEKKIKEGQITLQEATLQTMEKALTYLNDNEPIILIGLCGPLYPQIRTSKYAAGVSVKSIGELITEYTKEHALKHYERRHFFMGICDFSYLGFQMEEQEIEVLEKNMPGFGTYYSVPLAAMKTLNLELVNIGPWGKDLHMITERVYKPDFHFNTPNIMLHVLKDRLKIAL